VLPISPGVDRIFFRGSTTLGNIGGLNYADYSGTAEPTVQVALSAAALTSFVRDPNSVDVASVTVDADGNVYLGIYNGQASTTPYRRQGILKWDTQGRLSKVISWAERQATFGGSPNANVLRPQARTTKYPDPNGFAITQILYQESSSINAVGGAYVFKTGDFNRDNVLDPNDIALLIPKITLVGVVKTDPNDLKFDMNFDATVDYYDVQILRQFYDLCAGDVNLDGKVDYADFQVLVTNFGLTGKLPTEGDLNGDGAVTYADFLIILGTYGCESSVIAHSAPDLTPLPPVAGDANCDLLVNIDPFVMALTDPAGYAATYVGCPITNCDTNGDLLVNNGDIDSFVALLVGG
jgi:hypothetical protein